MKIYFPEITFSAAHYIPNHEQCSRIHGHTYFVRNLEINVSELELDEVGMSVDFGIIKGFFKSEWDHKFIIPEKDEEYWKHIYEQTGCLPVSDGRKVIRYTTAEWMAIVIRRDLGELLEWSEVDAAMNIHFELWEGPNQAVKV